MTGRVTVLAKNKQLVEIFALYDRIGNGGLGDYVNSAADLTATLKDAAGSPVTGFSGIALAYLANTNGDYRGAVGASVDPTPSSATVTYTLHVESSTTGINFQLPATVKARTTEGVSA